MTDPYIRPVGHVRTLSDGRLEVGVDYGAVTVGRRRLDSYQAAEFARLFADACLQAGRQAGELTAAARAELRAAAADMCLADCGGREHDRACTAAAPAATPWRPPCDSPGCVSHYDTWPPGCICPGEVTFAGGYHLLARVPKCRAHLIPAPQPPGP